MMGNEQDIIGFEHKVVKKVHYEVRSTKLKYQVLKGAVLGSKPKGGFWVLGIFDYEHGKQGRNIRWGSMK